MKQIADARENEKAMEKLHVFENKLFIAEQNREKEIQKKLDSIRKHVRFVFKRFSLFSRHYAQWIRFEMYSLY